MASKKKRQKRAKRTKRAAKKPAGKKRPAANGRSKGTMRRQAHGGALKSGGNPPPAPGPGRPPSVARAAVRARTTGLFEQYLDQVEGMLKSKKIRPSDFLGAMKILGTFGPGPTSAAEDEDDRARQPIEMRITLTKATPRTDLNDETDE